MSYQKMDQVTSPFTLFIPRGDDAVKDINTEENNCIDVEVDIGY